MAFFGRPSERDDERAQAYAKWLRERNPLAIASLVLGIFSLIEAGALIIPGIAGAVCGLIALRQLRQPDAQPPLGHRIAWSGIVISVISLIIAAMLYLPHFRR